MTAAAEQASAWLRSFTEQRPAAPWTRELKEAAFARFGQTGFPTTHEEDWRFTNVAPIARTVFSAAVPTEADAAALVPFAEGVRLVFVNGFFASAASEIPRGVYAGNLTEDAAAYLGRQAGVDSAFCALNTAFLADAAFVRIDRGAVVDQPIHLIFLTTANGGREPQATHPRTLIVAGPDSQCTVVETYVGDGRYFTNAVTEIAAGPGAVVDHYKVQMEALESFHIGSIYAGLGRSANFTSTSISIGAALARNDVTVTLSEGSEASLNGLYLVNGSQHVDNHTAIDHAKPHGTSRELYKGILDGKATAVFNGRILVRKDAQKTDSKQTNKNLVLSDEAVINTKPELQIFADDVRCTHGATIGQLDAEALFYLQSRGIGRNQARNLLTYAFAQDIADRVRPRPLRDSIERVLLEKFHERPY